MDEKKIDYNYEKDKMNWILYKDNRPKIKVRKFISDMAKKLRKAGYGDYKSNRATLIIAFNKGGPVHATEIAIKLLDSLK